MFLCNVISLVTDVNNNQTCNHLYTIFFMIKSKLLFPYHTLKIIIITIIKNLLLIRLLSSIKLKEKIMKKVEFLQLYETKKPLKMISVILIKP